MNEKQDQVTHVSLNKVKLSRNSRLTITDDEIDGLMQSIKQTGLLQPIGLIKRGTGYEIAFGNRRFLAVSKLGWSTVPAIVRVEKNDFDVDMQNLTENVQRRNISLSEIGRYIEILHDERDMSFKECAVRMGVPANYVKAALSAYHEVPVEYRKDIESRTVNSRGGEQSVPGGKISLGTANAIVQLGKRGLMPREKQQELFKLAKKHGSKFNRNHVKKYARNLEKGLDIFTDVPAKHMMVIFYLSEPEVNRLTRKHIDNGPFKSLSGLCRAILQGSVVERLKIEADV